MLDGREVTEVEALVTDRYLDALLTSAEISSPRDALAAGAARELRRLDLGVRLASDRLTRDLPRFHPSFRFEERLALRLAEAAAAMRLPAAAGAEGSVTPMPGAVDPWPGFDPLGELVPDDGVVPDRRPLIISGAMAASALSLAGAAWVAWRRGRHVGSPMARAARAAHALRGRPA